MEDPLEKLLQSLEEEGIIVEKTFLKSIIALALKVDDVKAIYYNDKLIKTKAELRTALVHEQIHLESYYSMYYLKDNEHRKRAIERHVNFLTARRLISADALQLCLDKRLELWEAAEELCTREDVVLEAFEYYKMVGKLKLAV